MRTVLFALLACLAGCTVAPPPTSFGGPPIPPVALAEGRAPPAPLRGLLQLPPSAARVPVVIVLYGCGGMGSNTSAWAERLQGWGLWHADPRQLRSARRQHRLRARQAAAGNALRPGGGRGGGGALATDATRGVDAGRIAVLGNSHGGATAETVALEPYAAAVAGSVRGVVDYYGACRDLPRYSGTKLLALAGADDNWGNPARTCERFKAEAPAGSDITVRVYPDTVHAFDNPRLLGRRWVEGHPMQYNRAAAADSLEAVHDFLAVLS